MDHDVKENIPAFLESAGLNEMPMGVMFADHEPEEAFMPKPGEIPTLDKEKAGTVDWGAVFGNFSCAIGHIWRARKKKGTACFSAERFGCPGCAFWMGFNKPQAETIIHYVSTGIPGRMEGELYCDSPDTLRRMFEMVDPEPLPKPFCVFKPLDCFKNDEEPVLVTFFSRAEALCGIHQLATFVTGDPEVVVSPWSAACGGLIAWPMHYLAQGKTKAVLGGWDPSARKFFKGDELSFTVPYAMFTDMVGRFNESFLTTETFKTVRKKIGQSRSKWGEDE